MYLAAMVCNNAKSHWLTPARWMYYHLLDGDLASNALSWQWVAGTFSHKKYIANQQNINKYLFNEHYKTVRGQVTLLRQSLISIYAKENNIFGGVSGGHGGGRAGSRLNLRVPLSSWVASSFIRPPGGQDYRASVLTARLGLCQFFLCISAIFYCLVFGWEGALASGGLLLCFPRRRL
mgnify:CR=1 FL=1